MHASWIRVLAGVGIPTDFVDRPSGRGARSVFASVKDLATDFSLSGRLMAS